jgi:hypothetical protein
MARVGKVGEIWRYPVKSLAGHTMTNAEIGQTGIVGDRAWAIRNDADREIQGAKKFPVLMQCSARFRNEPDNGKIPHVDITLADGSCTASDDPAVNEKLSRLVGKRASLWPIQPPTDLAHYRRRPMNEQEFMAEVADIFQREPGEPYPDLAQFPEEILEFTSFPGMYFDVTPIHVLTTSSLAYMRAKNASGKWDVRRFRPNFLIHTEGPGLVELKWVGRQLRLGSAVLQIGGPTPRCGMTTRAQEGLPFDKSILRTIVKDGDQNLGVYAVVAQPGAIKAGDPVELI